MAGDQATSGIHRRFRLLIGCDVKGEKYCRVTCGLGMSCLDHFTWRKESVKRQKMSPVYRLGFYRAVTFRHLEPLLIYQTVTNSMFSAVSTVESPMWINCRWFILLNLWYQKVAAVSISTKSCGNELQTVYFIEYLVPENSSCMQIQPNSTNITRHCNIHNTSEHFGPNHPSS